MLRHGRSGAWRPDCDAVGVVGADQTGDVRGAYGEGVNQWHSHRAHLLSNLPSVRSIPSSILGVPLLKPILPPTLKHRAPPSQSVARHRVGESGSTALQRDGRASGHDIQRCRDMAEPTDTTYSRNSSHVVFKDVIWPPMHW